jgi:chromate transporter
VGVGRRSLSELFRLFIFLGTIGVGGPAAHVALMHDHVVRRRGWVDDREFTTLVGATALIPGPNSTELAMAIGHRRGGVKGLLVAGTAFIAPAVLIVGALAYAYVEYGARPVVDNLRYGVFPVVAAIVVVALVRLRTMILGSPLVAVIAAGAIGLNALGLHEVFTLLASGVAMLLARSAGNARRTAFPALVGIVAATMVPGFWRILALFAEIGSLIFGSGYVLLAFLDSQLVQDRGWITGQQLLDAVAIGQVTPGPVFTTATFVGWQVSGIGGAAAATVGIFAPSFVFAFFVGSVVRVVERHEAPRHVLDGVATGSIALMAVVAVRLVESSVTDFFTGAALIGAGALLLFTRLNSAWLIGAGVVLGLLVGS